VNPAGPAAGLLTVALVLTGCTAVSGEETPLPEVTVLEFGNTRPVELSTLRGPMVINLWGSYCGPCRREMPILQDFHEQHGDDVEVVGIDYQDPLADEAARLVEETGVTYRLLSDVDGEVNSADPFPNIMGLPFLALVDEDGNVAYMEYGEIESVDELERLVDEQLGVDV